MQKTVRTLVVALAFVSMTFSASLAGAATTHPSYPLGKAKSCKVHYVKRVLSHQVRGKTVHYLACVYKAPTAPKPVAPAPTPPPPTTPTTVATTTSVVAINEASNNTLLVTAKTVGGTGTPVGSLSVSLTDKATGAVLGTWMAGANTTITSSGASIQWSYVYGSSVTFTLSTTAIGGISWSGPPSVSAPVADVSGDDIEVQATFGGSTGWGPSSSPLTTAGI